jgi:hypothetical protein
MSVVTVELVPNNYTYMYTTRIRVVSVPVLMKGTINRVMKENE